MGTTSDYLRAHDGTPYRCAPCARISCARLNGRLGVGRSGSFETCVMPVLQRYPPSPCRISVHRQQNVPFWRGRGDIEVIGTQVHVVGPPTACGAPMATAPAVGCGCDGPKSGLPLRRLHLFGQPSNSPPTHGAKVLAMRCRGRLLVQVRPGTRAVGPPFRPPP